MANLFDSIPIKKPNRNHFDLTHDVKFSLDMGNICPILALECVPGDKFNISAETLLRFQPLVAPVMHRMDVSVHYFFVPNRILWDKWNDWIFGNDDISELPSTFINPTTFTRLHDYLGLPTPTLSEDYLVTPFAMAAYQCIYNEYYRDQNLVLPVNYKLVDGDNSGNMELGMLRKRSWMHDYFTSSLPFAQKGAAVNIPMTFGDAPVKFNIDGGTGAGNNVVSATHNGTADDILVERQESNDPDIGTTLYAANGDMKSSALISDLRRAEKLQEWLELLARSGSRAVEALKAFFNVTSRDSRQQRPEYITGIKTPVVVSEVLNTTGETSGLPQGNMSGHAISVGGGKNGSYFCEEHGYIIGVMSVLPLPAYQQGIPKHFLKKNDRFNYFWRQFEHIGEQEVVIEELYSQAAAYGTLFGYVPRYAEYKYMPSRVAGDLKTSLDFWHLGRIFATEPTLSQEFIECVPDKRIFAVTDPDQDSLICHVLNKISAVRPMAKYGQPSF
ncbi:major capsid protein [Blackfly microvirus SF02]|uniref:Major capsid protein n=1 Tax=Blackfly microvirus SF02 TaxID=2576452 RepID=A0A4P8PQ57_9VIRU|nr:major capsid protein [Blackfly microvirus SF02]